MAYIPKAFIGTHKERSKRAKNGLETGCFACLLSLKELSALTDRCFQTLLYLKTLPHKRKQLSYR